MHGNTKPLNVDQSFLSVIIPAYRAEKFIADNLQKVKNVMDQIRYDYEIICVVDGKIDKTYRQAKKISLKYPEKIKVFGNKNNLGKGHAVRFGMAKSSGNIIAFIDADMELNPNGLSMLLEHFEWYNADIVVGSKRHSASKVTYPWERRVLSFGYQILVKILFGLKIRDTQVGLKFFKRKVLEKTLPRLLLKTYAFDIEMLSVANYLGFKRIYEAPVELKMKFGGFSTLISKSFIKTILRMLWDTLAVFYRLRILNYYDYKNRKSWKTGEYLTLNNQNTN